MRCETRKKERGRKKLLRRIDKEIKYHPQNASFIEEMLGSYLLNYGTDWAYKNRESKYEDLIRRIAE